MKGRTIPQPSLRVKQSVVGRVVGYLKKNAVDYLVSEKKLLEKRMPSREEIQQK